jgi:hypothetical protein
MEKALTELFRDGAIKAEEAHARSIRQDELNRMLG